MPHDYLGNIKIVKQWNHWTCGPATLIAATYALGLPKLSHTTASRMLGVTRTHGTDTRHFEAACRSIAAKHDLDFVSGDRQSFQRIARLRARGYSVILCYRTPITDIGHYGLFCGMHQNLVVLADPESSSPIGIETAEFQWETGTETPQRKRWFCAIGPG